MGKRARIIVGSIGGLLILIVIASFIANPIIESKIKKAIAREIPKEFLINDYDISVSTFTGSVTIENLQAFVNDTISVFRDSQISLSKASVNGLSYWKYLFSNKIAVDDITLYDLHIKTYRDTTEADNPKKQHKDFRERISAGKFSLENASFLFKNADKSIALQVDSLHFSIKNVEVNQTTLQEKIPFYFSEMEVETGDFFYEINKNETLSLKKLSIKNQQLKITEIAIQTKSDTLKSNKEARKEQGYKDIKIPTLALSDLYFEVVDDTFQLFGENLELDSPSVLIQKGLKEKPGKTKNAQKESGKKEMPLPFTFASLIIKDAKITLLNTDETMNLQVEDFNLNLKDIVVNTLTLQRKIPAQFSGLEIKSNAIQYRLNDYDLLSLTSISLKNRELEIKDIAIKTRYSKAELSRIISKERDHMDAEMTSVSIKGFTVSSKDSTVHILGSSASIENPNLKVYRDKLVADDTGIKPLYSKTLRELPFALTIDSLFINNAGIVYEEKIKAGIAPGRVSFSDLNATIGHLSNTYAQGEKETTVGITTTFMEKSRLEVDWRFDINNSEDRFQFSGQLGPLDARHLNSFAKAGLNLNLKGTLNQTYFNIHGNDNDSRIDMQLTFADFKVEVLDRKENKNRLLSSVANIFVKRNSVSKDNSFREASATAARNKDKSVFNYIWISILAGLKEIMVNL